VLGAHIGVDDVNIHDLDNELYDDPVGHTGVEEHVRLDESNVDPVGHVGCVTQFFTVLLYDDPLGVLHIGGVVNIHIFNVVFNCPFGHVGVEEHLFTVEFHDEPVGHPGFVFNIHSDPDGVFIKV
jgi:hypothetical protein